MALIEGKTNAPAYVFNVNDINPNTVEDPKYNVTPLLTVGDEAPYVATLVGYGVLDADTFAPGPASGNFITTPNRETPFESQPVQGFSDVQFADGNSFYFLSDNGFGSKTNSADYLLRIYKVDPEFAGAEKGDGSVQIEDFIQLSDPNNLVPFAIVNEETSDRLLTGADFDVESLVLANDGTFWIGEEFGPYVLHFNADGELINAPIATPNLYDIDTITGEKPLVIAHRGASGYRPEHTLEAYRLGIELGADFIEPDLVLTKDGVLIARHENALAIVQTDASGNIVFDDNGDPVIREETTNVADLPQFRNRLTSKIIDNQVIVGWFSEDFTLEEIKQLKARERIPNIRPENTAFNDLFEVPTLAEVIQLVKQVEAETGRKIGIYPETKHPTYFDSLNLGTDMETELIKTLVDNDFTDPDRVFIQSFEVGNLKELNNVIMPEYGVDLPLVQLLSDSGAPFDFIASGEDRTYADLITPEGLEEINDYAEGIGPFKRMIVPAQNNNLLSPTSLITDAHEAGLLVHPYTFRDERNFLANDYNGDPLNEYEQFIQLDADGFFSDNTDTAVLAVDKATTEYVRSPQNPAVIFDGAVSNLSSSRGYEGMGYSPDRMTLYPLLEGSVFGDPDDALRIYKFDVSTKSFANELAGYYQLEDPSYAIGAMTPINDNEFLIIERDNAQGDAANFKKVFKIDLSQQDEKGFVEKTELVDLLNIADPNDLNSDGSLVFEFPYQTIESVLVLDENTLLLANDNNYPFSIGRPPGIDNTEFIQIELPYPLDLSPLLGLTQVSLSAASTTIEEGEQLTFDFLLSQSAPEGGLTLNLSFPEDLSNDLEFLPNTSANITDFQLSEGGATITIAQGATSADLVFNVKADRTTEGEESYSFDLVKGTGYRINPDSASESFTIEDTSLTPQKVVTGTSGADFIDTVEPDSAFIGAENQVLFTGSGDDYVDVSQSPDAFNRIDLGSGDDLFFAGVGDRVFAGSGDDTLFLGSGGNNIVTGGTGADQFWLTTDDLDLPTMANTITDFDATKGDVLVFGATALTFDSLGTNWNIRQDGSKAIIEAFGQDVAILLGVNSNSLLETSFVFG